MTLKQLFLATNMDLNKIQAPAVKLYEFNYFANKAVNKYINKVYSSVYDINQQTTDDLRVLKSTVVLKPNTKVDTFYTGGGKSYEVHLPGDYLHLLNCICVFEPNADYMCYDAGSQYAVAAKRLTADSWANILDDVYNAPSALNPYYYIHNVVNYSNSASSYSTPLNFNEQAQIPVSAGDSVKKDSATATYSYQPASGNDSITGGSTPGVIPEDWAGVETITFTYAGESGDAATDVVQRTYVDGKVTKTITTDGVQKNTAGNATGTYTSFPRTVALKDGDTVSAIEKPGGVRIANPSTVRVEIRCGDTSICELKKVSVDYIKAPQHLRLTQRQFDSTKDISQVLEFPDYICQEIENELLAIIMEHAGDPRLQNTIQMSQTISRPAAQQLSQPQA